jgi:predicted lipoprotein with Yx(FWY)xxD motif
LTLLHRHPANPPRHRLRRIEHEIDSKGVRVKSRFLKSRVVAAGAVVAVLGVTAAAIAATGTPSQVKTRKTSVGTVIVDGKASHTLYLFGKDKNGKSSCTGACASNWPPYLTKGKPKAGPGAKQSLLGTFKRSNGTLQVTYNKHPLYWFKFDKAAGSTKGQDVSAFGGSWYVVSAKGAAIKPSAPTGGGGYGGGYGGTGSTGATGSGGGGYQP